MKTKYSLTQWAVLLSFSALGMQLNSSRAQPGPVLLSGTAPASISCNNDIPGNGNKDLQGLQVEWFQWALSSPTATSPLLDTTGENAGLGQHGPVWFLAGNFGGTVQRTNTVPPDRSLFFPVINSFWIGFNGDPPWNQRYTDPTTGIKYRSYETYVRQIVLKPAIDAANNLQCVIDGKQVPHLEKYRIQSPTFEVWLPKDNVFGLDNNLYSYGNGVYQPCADDGIYLLLAPLPPGQHVIHFTAPTMNLDVTYYLTIVPSVAR